MRSNLIQQFENQVFDLCIIGGGASGAGCALDAALRGLKVALIEKEDFSAGTSSRSTKLIHGGVRYLEQAIKKLDFKQLKQVKHGLHERHIVLSNAPHLAQPLALLTPVYSWFEGLYFTIGLKIYGLFASGKDALPGSKWLNKTTVMQRLPGLHPDIHSAVLYYDGQLDDARYCLALAQSAQKAGALVLNHAEVVGFEQDESGKLNTAHIAETISPTSFPHKWRVRARQFLNCCGPFADRIRLMANPLLSQRIRPSKGVHAILPGNILGGDDALLIPKTKDGRVIFAIPFCGQLLVGTTDNDYQNLEEEPVLEPDEINFLIETLQPFSATKIDRTQIKAGFGGLRPLVIPGTQDGKQTKSMLRDHEVEYDEHSGLLSLLGGKWTTYRLMAKDAIDKSCDLLGHSANCKTENYMLYGAEGYSAELWQALSHQYPLSIETAQHLAQHYGGEAWSVLTLLAENPDWNQPLIAGKPYLRAEVIYAIRHEMAFTIRDFLSRRIRLEITDWVAALAAAPQVAQLMGEELGWNKQTMQIALDDYLGLIRGFMKKAEMKEEG